MAAKVYSVRKYAAAVGHANDVLLWALTSAISSAHAGPKAKRQKPPQHQYDFDLFTIGGGSAGVRAARYSAGMGELPAMPSGLRAG